MAAGAARTRKLERESFDATRKHARGKSLLLPLKQLAGDFRGRVRAGLRRRGHESLQPAHSSVIVNLETSGTRLTELADRTGVTKQAMGKLVAELETIGYVELTADPDDGRAKIARFSDDGLVLLADAGEVVEEIWNYYAGLLGERRLAALRGSLTTLLSRIDDDRRASRR